MYGTPCASRAGVPYGGGESAIVRLCGVTWNRSAFRAVGVGGGHVMPSANVGFAGWGGAEHEERRGMRDEGQWPSSQ